jgi:hypothetical protein
MTEPDPARTPDGDPFTASSEEMLLRWFPPRSYVKWLAGRWFGPRFLSSLRENLCETALLFHGDTDLRGRLKAVKPAFAASALSEIWLGANLLRIGSTLRRLPKIQGSRTPDFKASIPLQSRSLRCYLEAKRIFPGSGRQFVSASDKPRGRKNGGAVPLSLANSDFIEIAAKRIHKAKGQFTASPGLSSMVALDVSESHTYQLLVADEEDEFRLREEAGVQEDQTLFVYVLSWDLPTFLTSRWYFSRLTV